MGKLLRSCRHFSIFFLIQFYSLVGLYFSVCITTNQIGRNDGFEVEESKLIRVHHVVEMKLPAQAIFIESKEMRKQKRIDDLQSKL